LGSVGKNDKFRHCAISKNLLVYLQKKEHFWHLSEKMAFSLFGKRAISAFHIEGWQTSYFCHNANQVSETHRNKYVKILP
jgi:hypothetical protein